MKFGKMFVIATIIVIAVLVVTSCGSVPMVRACGSKTTPPVAVADASCKLPGFKWYTAVASDVDEDDRPVIGYPLDDDFWDPKARTSVRTSAPKTTAPKTTTAKPSPSKKLDTKTTQRKTTASASR